MPSIEKVVDFLEINRALKSSNESPWPVWSDEENPKAKRYLVNWHGLFPANRRRNLADEGYDDG